MTEDKNGFVQFEGQRLFSVTPDEIIWRMRDGWLDAIEKKHNMMCDVILPYLEQEAVSRFGREYTVQIEDRPNIRDGYDDWRMWWLNEASHNCKIHSPIGLAGDHLTQIGQVAVNILMAASALREALDKGDAQEAAALGMMLICEAIAGGYSIDMESTKSAVDAIRAAKTRAYQTGAGRNHQELQLAKKAAISFAKKTWIENPDMRIGEMADTILLRLKNHKEKFPTLESFPKTTTIKTWLREAGAENHLVIPDAAQKRGRKKAN